MTKPTVLVVEDERVLQDAYKLILTTAGFTVFTANNGAEALEQLEREAPCYVTGPVYARYERSGSIAQYRQARLSKYENNCI